MELGKWLSDCSFDNAPIEFNGKIKRFSRNGTQSRDAWCIGWSHRGKDGKEIQFAIVGDWSTGEKFEYKPFNGHLDPADYAKIKENARLASEAAEREREKTHEETARRAGEIWEKAARAGKSDYLKSKGLEKSFGARFDGATLIIPCRDGTGTIWGIQRISADGQKRFLTGQRKKGCYHLLHENFSGPACRPHYLFLSEGFATAASIVMALDGSEFAKAYDYQVLCAFDSANLEPVAAVLRDLHPTSEIVIAADDDRWEKDGTQKVEGRPNVGIEKARHTAKLVKGIYVVPHFCESHHQSRPTDFNDLHHLQGNGDVLRQLLDGLGWKHTSASTHTSTMPSFLHRVDGLEIHEEPIPASQKKIGPPPEVIKLDAENKDKLVTIPIGKMGADAMRGTHFEIMDPHFRQFHNEGGSLVFEVVDEQKKELRLCTNWDYVVSRSAQFLRNKKNETMEPSQLRKYLTVWKEQGENLPYEPKPFTWGDEDAWSYRKLQFVPTEGIHPAWDEFLLRLSNADEFMAFIWSIFEMKNESRQFLYLYDPAGEGGKSTIIRILGEIFGDGAFCGIQGTMINGAGSRWLASSLYGKRLVAWADCKNPKFCMSEVLRNVTSGDNVSVEFKGKPVFTTKMYVKLIIGSNMPPEITGAGADTSRLIRIDMKENRINKDDPHWADKLREQLPHFLWDCRLAYERLCVGHGKIALTDETSNLVMESTVGTESHFADIVEERMIRGSGRETTSKNFRALCQEERLDDMRMGNFKAYLAREYQIYSKRQMDKENKGVKVTMYHGFSIRPARINNT